MEPEAQPEVKEEPVAGEAPGAAATTSNGGEGAAAAASNGDATGGGGPEAQPGEEGGEAGAGASKQKQKGWSLEDDDEDSDDGGGGGDPDEEMPDADGDGDGDALRPPPMLGKLCSTAGPMSLHGSGPERCTLLTVNTLQDYTPTCTVLLYVHYNAFTS